MADVMSRATRDADLALLDEFESIAAMIASARGQATSAERQTKTWQQSSLDALYRPYAKEKYDVASAATGANMGTAGYNRSGLRALAAAKMAGSSEIVNTSTNRLMAISEELNAALDEASRAKSTIARKKTLLVGQLADKYRQEADMVALEREKMASENDWREWQKGQAGGDVDRQSDLAFRQALGPQGAALSAAISAADPQEKRYQARKSKESLLALASSYGIDIGWDEFESRYGAMVPSDVRKYMGVAPPAMKRTDFGTGAKNIPKMNDDYIGMPISAIGAGGIRGQKEYNPPGNFFENPLTQMMYALGWATRPTQRFWESATRG